MTNGAARGDPRPIGAFEPDVGAGGIAPLVVGDVDSLGWDA